MRIARKSLLARVFATIGLLAGAWILFAYLHNRDSKPLGMGPPIDFPSGGISESAMNQFLDGDFLAVKDLKDLPSSVRQTFTEEGGTRLVMANPGEKFVVGDVIYDQTLPRKRLIFGGVQRDKCFLHYEQGGRSHDYIVAFFNLNSTGNLTPRWRVYCGPATDIQDLRSQVRNAQCSNPVPPEIR